MMKRTANTLSLCMALLCSMLLTACVYDNIAEPKQEKEDTYINLSFSSADTRTRAAVSDELEGESGENTITSLRVWAFDSDNQSVTATALSYREETALNVTNGKHSLTMKIPTKTGGRDLKRIDLYILANAESGTNLTTAADNRMLTRSDLKGKCVTESFGVNTNGDAQCITVPQAGLPMARIVTGISIDAYKRESENEQKPSVNIPLTRAVSKMHFFFARRTDGATDEVEVTGIQVAGSVIPTGSYVFPMPVAFNSSALPDVKDERSYTGYVDAAITKSETLEANNIAVVDEPVDYKRGDTEDADKYMARLAKAGINGRFLTYLRETDKTVPVTIRYRLTKGDAEKAVTVNVEAGDLRRNHEVVIYGYFLETGQLTVEPQVLDWVDGGEFDFNSTREVTLTHSNHKETVYEGDNRVAVAWQNVSGGATPTCSPLISFKAKVDSRRWVLQTDNPDFGFLLEGATTLTDHIVGYGDEVRFYFMPRKELDLTQGTNRKASIFMTLPDEDNSRVLINVGDSKMAGTDEEIRFYQVSKDEYDGLPFKN